jgi:stage II sporulation protein D
MSRALRLHTRRAAGLAVAGVALAAVACAPARAASTPVQTVPVGTAKYFAVPYRGNGHGHGMSQYGARGAARAGLSYKKILAFYYPGTSLVSAPKHSLRVKLSGTGSTTTVAARSLTTVTGMRGYLPTSGIRKYRLVADAKAGLTLQRLGSAKGSSWTNVRTGLPNRAEFYRRGSTRLYLTDGTSTDYSGYLRAVRKAGGGVMTVNRVGLNTYVAGVVPREMPASWEAAALDAQAVAARTYASNAVASPGNAEYDICDSTQCQVYGGVAHYDTDGSRLWSWYPKPAGDTVYQILSYKGRAAFAQFSASNGGWTVAGGQPYLTAKSDPYDSPARSFDPYIGVTKKVTVASVATYFGLTKLTKLTISKRDGHGQWGGRVLAGSVTGINRSGHSQTVSATGYDFAGAFGLGTTWLQVTVTSR